MKLYYGWKQAASNQAANYPYIELCAWIDEPPRLFSQVAFLECCRPEIANVIADTSRTKRVAVKLTPRAKAVLLAKDQPSNYLLSMLLNTLELVEAT